MQIKLCLVHYQKINKYFFYSILIDILHTCDLFFSAAFFSTNTFLYWQWNFFQHIWFNASVSIFSSGFVYSAKYSSQCQTLKLLFWLHKNVNKNISVILLYNISIMRLLNFCFFCWLPYVCLFVFLLINKNILWSHWTHFDSTGLFTMLLYRRHKNKIEVNKRNVTWTIFCVFSFRLLKLGCDCVFMFDFSLLH